MRRLLVAAAACVLLAGCGSAAGGGDAGGQAGGPIGSPGKSTKFDPASPELVAKRKASDLEPCAAGPVKDGGLPKVTLPCLGGGASVSLASLRGPLILNFFQGGCVPCRKEMPALEAFHQTYGSRVQVVGIDTMDTLPGVALSQAVARGVTFQLYADPDGSLQGGPLSVGKVPATYVLSAGGQVKLLQMGGMTSADQVKDLVEQKLGITL